MSKKRQYRLMAIASVLLLVHESSGMEKDQQYLNSSNPNNPFLLPSSLHQPHQPQYTVVSIGTNQPDLLAHQQQQRPQYFQGLSSDVYAQSPLDGGVSSAQEALTYDDLLAKIEFLTNSYGVAYQQNQQLSLMLQQTQQHDQKQIPSAFFTCVCSQHEQGPCYPIFDHLGNFQVGLTYLPGVDKDIRRLLSRITDPSNRDDGAIVMLSMAELLKLRAIKDEGLLNVLRNLKGIMFCVNKDGISKDVVWTGLQAGGRDLVGNSSGLRVGAGLATVAMRKVIGGAEVVMVTLIGLLLRQILKSNKTLEGKVTELENGCVSENTKPVFAAALATVGIWALGQTCVPIIKNQNVLFIGGTVLAVGSLSYTVYKAIIAGYTEYYNNTKRYWLHNEVGTKSNQVKDVV